ncbi:MAG: polysaccharide biosynthesis tyrosine autokinase [Altibacter sp.]|uniref:GumC family protein n=1 Tax=Altibacter sp. TaxID=2024823 RepID=UPI001D527AC6|nr:polysaccharide biosynthesis tyrosine autokinase [Altibacter sp.]MBZ0327472.1 polysaccharide biosynthesis tyrosine autokinase [Altibacter sp.]
MDEFTKNTESNDTSLRELVERYTRYWFWFVLGIVVAMVLSYLYLRYTTPSYQTNATVIVKDEKSGGGPSELAAFADLGSFFSKYNSRIENELAIFNSKRIIAEVVKELNLNITYQAVGTIKTSELYEFKPFNVQYLSFTDSTRVKVVPKLFFEVLSVTDYIVENESGTVKEQHTFGERVALPFGDITVLPVLDNREIFDSFIGRKIAVTYRPIEAISLAYQRKISIVNNIKNSNVVNISLLSPVPEKAEDFINELIFQYNKDAINDQNQVAQKTSNFIDSRLEIITKELDSVERNKEQFKSSNRLTDIETEAQLILQNASEYNKRQSGVATQLELANTMIDYMEKSSSNDLLPANIGLDGQEIGEAVNNYNQLILQRNKLLKASTAKNPVVINVNNQIEQIRSNILNSLQNTSNGLKISMRDLNFQEAALNSKIAQVPTKEKLYRGIERQQSIKEQLYLFLLQQREEASISLAVTAPKAKIVDSSYSSKAPVSPNKPLIYIGALLAGLLLPFVGIYGFFLLSTKVTNRRDIEKVLRSTPMIGEIPKLKKSDEELIQHNDRSILAESFRILRTNLQYLFVNKDTSVDEAKTVFVTSTIKGEGKTLVAFNLALTLALTGKKVVLVGADIRNPQLHRYLPESERKNRGLTEFIMDDTLTVTQLASQSEYNKNLDIVLSGVIPPNPAELLMQNRTNDFFREIKRAYDYVIVDTAPSMLVTDTLLINKFADITLYVVRAGYTDKRLLEFPKDAMEEGRLSNLAIVLNNVDMSNFGYGNKYGYTYSDEKRTWRHRIFRK